MNIGIAAPIEIMSLRRHLPSLNEDELKLGLGGTAVNIIIDGLIDLGHTVTVFTLDRTIKNKYVITGPKLKIIFGHFRPSFKMKCFDFCGVEYKQIRDFIIEEKHNLDVVNAHWSYEFAIGAILAKVPHLITFRDHSQTILRLNKGPYRLTRLFMDLWVRWRGHHFSYNSQYLKSLIKLPGAVIPNPISSSQIETERSFPVNKPVLKICYIANGWDYRKNPEAAIEAVSKLHERMPNVELHMIGKGFEQDNERYKKTITGGLSSFIKFRGSLPHAQFMTELRDFDIMLHTAREESFGNNLIEAMAKGVPVIAGRSAGAVPWVLNDGLAGCLTDVESPQAISDDLFKILTDQEYYEFLSRNGISNLTNRFVQEKVCSHYVLEYKKIID